MRKLILAVMALLIMASCAMANNFKAGDVIVVLKSPAETLTASSFGVNGAATLRASDFARSAGTSLTKTYPALSAIGNNIFALVHSDDIDPESFSQELLKNPDVLAASPNYIVRAAVTPNDEMYSTYQWDMDTIFMTEAWDMETGSSSVYAAIIDSGIDWTNPELTPNVATDLGYNAFDNSISAMDDYGHGTHVAGTIGAVGNNGVGIAGMNWYVRMIPVKVLDENGSGNTDTVLTGMNYVADLMSQGMNIRVVNLSLETYTTLRPEHDSLVRYPMWRAFKNLDQYNRAVIVVAAGNHKAVIGQPTTRYEYEDGRTIYSPNCYVYPASFKGLNNMISVSATRGNNDIASYSNTNADISAPGGDYYVDRSIIVSTYTREGAYFITDEGIALHGEQGTSMAAPHVAGAAALIAAHDSTLTAYQIKQCILNSRLSGGEGMLDVAGALEYAEDNGRSLASVGSEGRAYDDYNSYSDYDYDYQYDYGYDRRDGGSSSSGCNGFMWGAIALVMFSPLVKKFMS